MNWNRILKILDIRNLKFDVKNRIVKLQDFKIDERIWFSRIWIWSSQILNGSIQNTYLRYYVLKFKAQIL